MKHKRKPDPRHRRTHQVSRRDFIKIAGFTVAASGTQLVMVGCGPKAANDEANDDKKRTEYPVVGPHRYIDKDLCDGCRDCFRLCPMGAIKDHGDKCSIDASECTECDVCVREEICAQDAIKTVELEWPRQIRSVFSDPLATHESTKMPGRGTEGIKTNDSKNVYKEGDLGVVIELGRPALGVRFHDVEKVVKKFKAEGYRVEQQNPVASLVIDETGALDPEVLNEKVISCLLEFVMPQKASGRLIEMVQELSEEVNTVFNLSVALRANEQGTSPLDDLFKSSVFRLPNGKVNIGLATDITKAEVES